MVRPRMRWLLRTILLSCGVVLPVAGCAPGFATRLNSGEQGRATGGTFAEASDVPLVPLNVNVRELPR